MKESRGSGHRHQDSDLSAATRLSKDRDVRRIAAKVRDVVTNPLERRDDVELSVVGRMRILLAVIAEIEISEEIQPMIETHHDDISSPRYILGVVLLAPWY